MTENLQLKLRDLECFIDGAISMSEPDTTLKSTLEVIQDELYSFSVAWNKMACDKINLNKIEEISVKDEN